MRSDAREATIPRSSNSPSSSYAVDSSVGSDRLEGLALDGDDVERLRPRAAIPLRLLLVVMRDERAGVVCMTWIVLGDVSGEYSRTSKKAGAYRQQECVYQVGNRTPEALKTQRVFFMVSPGVCDKSTAKTCSQTGESQGWQEQRVDVKFEV